MTRNILSIDIEEIFHAQYMRGYHGSCIDYRTPKNVQIVLKLLEKHDVKATFFIVGEIAKEFPEIIKMIRMEGHEIGFHGWTHVPLWESDQETFAKEVTCFRAICPDCYGFRAPTFSLNNSTRWALKTLGATGFKFDSSIFPVRIPLYGVSSAPQRPYKPSLHDVSKEGNPNFGILEFPLTAYRFFWLRFPIGGGFWLRLWNFDLTTRWIMKLNGNEIPAVVYVHNWELDPETPRINPSPFKSFITFHNIEETSKRFDHLLQDFEFTTFTQYMKTMEST